MHNANQIHEFIKLVYQDKLNWLWIIVNKVILFPPTPENVKKISNALIRNLQYLTINTSFLVLATRSMVVILYSCSTSYVNMLI